MAATKGLEVDAQGLVTFAKEIRSISPKLAKAFSQEFRQIGIRIQGVVAGSSATPYGPVDSKGKIGRKRRSIKISAKQRGLSLYSLEPDAGVWNWGGEIKPKGVPISIPETSFLSREVMRNYDHTAEAMGDILDGLVRRFAGFH